MKKNMLFPRVSLLLALLFLGACSTNDEVVTKDDTPIVLVMGSFCVNDPQPHPELVDIFPDIDFRSMAVSECRESILENGEKVNVCFIGGRCIDAEDPPHPELADSSEDPLNGTTCGISPLPVPKEQPYF